MIPGIWAMKWDEVIRNLLNGFGLFVPDYKRPGTWAQLQQFSPRRAERQWIELIHDPAYVDSLERRSPQDGYASLDPRHLNVSRDLRCRLSGDRGGTCCR